MPGEDDFPPRSEDEDELKFAAYMRALRWYPRDEGTHLALSFFPSPTTPYLIAAPLWVEVPNDLLEGLRALHDTGFGNR